MVMLPAGRTAHRWGGADARKPDFENGRIQSERALAAAGATDVDHGDLRSEEQWLYARGCERLMGAGTIIRHAGSLIPAVAGLLVQIRDLEAEVVQLRAVTEPPVTPAEEPVAEQPAVTRDSP